jgi:predicted AlkP superfamily pyrophosphatase or phosphodiesterase
MAPAVLILIDGLRADAVTHETMPNLRQLMMRGASTLQAQSVIPSVTLPCHMSIFHSVPPQRHGIMQNVYQSMARPLPGLVEQAYAAGLKCGFIYNWEPLRDLSRPEKLHFSYFVNNVLEPEGDRTLAQEAVRYIEAHAPDFLFLYLGSVDMYGHAYGWMSDEYLAQAGRSDAAVGHFMEHVSPDSSVILLADHGGHERNHGTDSPEDMTIPWMAVGPNIHADYHIKGTVTLLDTAPTLARIMNIKAAPEWEGRSVDEIFEA